MAAAAVEAVLAATALCRAVRRELADEHHAAKDDRSPVTVADLGSQALVSLILGEASPGVPIVGEEDASLLRADPDGPIARAVLRHVAGVRRDADASAVAAAIDRCSHPGGAAGSFWTLDPVDGTKGFLRGGQYAVALALLEDGQPVLGVLGCPNLPRATSAAATGAGSSDGLGVLLVAEAGAGTRVLTLDGDDLGPACVARPPDAAAARWVESVEAGHSAQHDAARVATMLGVATEPLRMDSQAKYAVVARGDAAIYLRLPVDDSYRERIWDHAAGWLVVREAGGEVTDVAGRPLEFGHGRRLERNRGVVATSGGELHGAVLDAVGAALGGMP